MKDLKTILVESKSAEYLPLDKVSYSMVSVTPNEDPMAFVLESTGDIEGIYKDWDFDKEDISSIMTEVKQLKANESYVHVTDNSEYEIITKLK